MEPWEIAPAFKDLLSNTSVQYVKDKVKLIQPSEPRNVSCGGSIQLESGVIIEYDWYIIRIILYVYLIYRNSVILTFSASPFILVPADFCNFIYAFMRSNLTDLHNGLPECNPLELELEVEMYFFWHFLSDARNR